MDANRQFPTASPKGLDATGGVQHSGTVVISRTQSDGGANVAVIALEEDRAVRHGNFPQSTALLSRRFRPRLRRICIYDDGSITRATLPQPFVRPFGPTRIGRSQLVNPAMMRGSVRRQWG